MRGRARFERGQDSTARHDSTVPLKVHEEIIREFVETRSKLAECGHDRRAAFFERGKLLQVVGGRRNNYREVSFFGFEISDLEQFFLVVNVDQQLFAEL